MRSMMEWQQMRRLKKRIVAKRYWAARQICLMRIRRIPPESLRLFLYSVCVNVGISHGKNQISNKLYSTNSSLFSFGWISLLASTDVMFVMVFSLLLSLKKKKTLCKTTAPDFVRLEGIFLFNAHITSSSPHTICAPHSTLFSSFYWYLYTVYVDINVWTSNFLVDVFTFNYPINVMWSHGKRNVFRFSIFDQYHFSVFYLKLFLFFVVGSHPGGACIFNKQFVNVMSVNLCGKFSVDLKSKLLNKFVTREIHFFPNHVQLLQNVN